MTKFNDFINRATGKSNNSGEALRDHKVQIKLATAILQHVSSKNAKDAQLPSDLTELVVQLLQDQSTQLLSNVLSITDDIVAHQKELTSILVGLRDTSRKPKSADDLDFRNRESVIIELTYQVAGLRLTLANLEISDAYSSTHEHILQELISEVQSRLDLCKSVMDNLLSHDTNYLTHLVHNNSLLIASVENTRNRTEGIVEHCRAQLDKLGLKDPASYK